MSSSLWPYGPYSCRLLCPWNSPGKNTRVGSHALLQEIFPTKGSNLCLLHCRRIPYHLIHQGKPKILYILLQIMGAWLFPNLKFKSDNNKITKLPEMWLELWSFQLRGRTRTESPDMTCSVPCNRILVTVWFCSAHYRKVKLPYKFLQIPRWVAKGKRWSPASK